MSPYKLGGYSGVLVELDWDSNVVWRYDNPVIHHDHTLLRNGNIMVIGWEELTTEQPRGCGVARRARRKAPTACWATSCSS